MTTRREPWMPSDAKLWDICDRCGKHGRVCLSDYFEDGREREGPNACDHPMVRAAARLGKESYQRWCAAQSGVDVDALAFQALVAIKKTKGPKVAVIADAIRTAIAQARIAWEKEQR